MSGSSSDSDDTPKSRSSSQSNREEEYKGLLLQDMHNQFVSKGNGASLSLEEQCTDLLQLSSLPKFEEFMKDKMVSRKITDFDVTQSFSKIVEWFHAHAELFGDNFQVLSRFMDDHTALASQALQTAKDEFSNVLELNESLRLNVATLEADKRTREAKISSLKKDLMLLLSTCSDATNELQIKFHDVVGLDSDSEQQKWSSSLDLISKDVSGGETEEGSSGEYAEVAQSLLVSVREVGIGFHQLVNAKRILMTSIDDLENKFKQEELTAKSAIKDRHRCEERISELERDLAELRNFCTELRLQIKEFQAKEDMLKDREADLTLQNTLTTKERGIGEKLFSEDQVEILIDKVNKMVIPFKELQASGQEVHFSSPVEKLYYVLDEVWELQRTIDSLTKDKDDMQLVIGSHAHEIEYLKKVIETMRTNHQDLELKKTEFTELTLGLEKIIQMLGGPSLLERLTMGLSIECENSKSRIQELGAKLQVKEKMVDDLSTKVKSLEESFQPRLLHPPESVKERTLFEPSSATGSSEISEIEVSHCQVMAVQQKIWEKLQNYLSAVTRIILIILAVFSLSIAPLYFFDSLLYISVFSLIGMFFFFLHFVIIIKGYPDGQWRNQGKVSEGFNSPCTGESPKFVKQLEKEAPPFHRSTLPENTPLIRRIRMKKNN